MLAEVAENAIGQTGTAGVGIPGSISPYTRVVKNANLTWLNRQPFDKDLSSHLNREVRSTSDANCLTVSEAVDDAATGVQAVFAATIDTRYGVGVVPNGWMHTDGNGTVGEWGHNLLPWMGEGKLRLRQEVPCHCGKQGCIETFAPGTGFAIGYRCLSGKKPEGNEITDLVNAQDVLAEQVLSRYGRRLAKLLAHMVNIFDPDVTVLDGEMNNTDRLYQNVLALIKQFVFGGECEAPLCRVLHGSSSGIRGAAWPRPWG